MYKLLICVVFCIALLSIVESATKPPVNAIWGARQPGDERLHYRIISGNPDWLFRKAVQDVDYPGKGAYSTGNITFIEAINQKPDSESSVTILKGGIGFPFVKLHFKSTRTKGFNYVLQIFGKLNNTQPPPQYVQPQPQYVQPQPQYVQPQPHYPPPYPQAPAYPARPY